MNIITKYVAWDGSEFSSEAECFNYEKIVPEPKEKYKDQIFLYNKYLEKLPLDTKFDWADVDFIMVTSSEAAEALAKIMEGYECPFEDGDYNNPGYYYYDEITNGWVNLEDMITHYQTYYDMFKKAIKRDG